MKIAHSLRALHSEFKAKYDPLQQAVDHFFKGNKNSRWHYESRVKTIDSFALKIESGRYLNPLEIDDFFACTIVVEHSGKIDAALDLIKSRFLIVNRRPKDDTKTHKSSDSFPFDDLRIYVRWIDLESIPATGLNNLLFEIQIKTFLQHAWSIATHDLTYKTSTVIWAKERISFQVKALLEHAEISIAEANSLCECTSLQKQDNKTIELNRIITILHSFWAPDSLPLDIKKLSTTVYNILKSLDISPETLHLLLSAETALGRGSRTSNLSPYAIIIQTLFNQDFSRIERYLTSKHNKCKIVIANETNIHSLDINKCKNAIFLPLTFPL